MKKLSTVFIVLLLVGCVSTHMKQYLGKDIREVMIDSGPPVNAFDMRDGKRAFQFRWGGGSFVVPQTTTYTGSATGIGNTSWSSGQAITTGGGIINSEECLITYLAHWSENNKSWIVNELRYPKRLVC